MVCNNKIFRKVATISSTLFLALLMVFIVLEPAVVNSAADSAVVTLTVSEEVTISSPDDASFSGSIPGVSGNPGAPVTASLTWTVKTNNDTGFNLKLKASQANALYKDVNYYFSDHTLTPSYGWTAPDTGVASFGFTIAAAIAADTVTAFKDNGAACGAGSNTGGCWSGFNGTNNISVINRSTRTDNDGEDEIVNFKAQSAGKLLKDGQYQATITTTVSTN